MPTWMSVNDELRPYSTQGSIVGKSPLISILADVEGFDPGSSMAQRDDLIRANWNQDFAARLLGKRLDDIIEDDALGWSPADEPRQVSAGVFLWAGDIDWEAGILEGEYLETILSEGEALFWDRDELFVSAFARADYNARLEGLSFPFDSIELLRPSNEGVAAVGLKSIAATRIGRPQKWDWEGAMAGLVAAAQHPDGLPTGPGAQARIEELIADWFASETGDTPSPSQIRQHASMLLRRMTRPESGKAF